MPKKYDDRTQAAYHEAGHVVTGYWFGAWLNEEGVEIDKRQYTGIRWRIVDFTLEATVVNTMAGLFAEGKYRHGKHVMRFDNDDALWLLEEVRNGYDGFGDSGDIAELLLKYHPTISDDEYIECLQYYQNKTRMLLNVPHVWRAVEKVAAALIKSGRLSNDEAIAVIDFDFWPRDCNPEPL